MPIPLCRDSSVQGDMRQADPLDNTAASVLDERHQLEMGRRFLQPSTVLEAQRERSFEYEEPEQKAVQHSIDLEDIVVLQ